MLPLTAVYAPPEVRDRRLWIMAVVLGGIVIAVALIWCALFIYYRAKKRSALARPDGQVGRQESDHKVLSASQSAIPVRFILFLFSYVRLILLRN